MINIEMITNEIVTKVVTNKKKATLIVGISGNIAVGKSTFAHQLKQKLQFENAISVGVVSTDDFLLSNHSLKEKGLFSKKGWPCSYDKNKIQHFFEGLTLMNAITLNEYYDQSIGDINQQGRIIFPCQVLIIEGLMTLTPLFRTHINYGLFLEANDDVNYHWYVERTMLRKPTSAEKIQQVDWHKNIQAIWLKTNRVNYTQFILPTRKYADLIIQLNQDHTIQQVVLHHQVNH